MKIKAEAELEIPLGPNYGGTGFDLSTQSSPANKYLGVNSSGDAFELKTPPGGGGGGGMSFEVIDLADDAYRKVTDIDISDLNITASTETGTPNFTLELTSGHMPTDSTYIESYEAVLHITLTSVNSHSGDVNAQAYLNGVAVDDGLKSLNLVSGENCLIFRLNQAITASDILGDILGLEIWGDSMDITLESIQLLVVPYVYAQSDIQMPYDLQYIGEEFGNESDVQRLTVYLAGHSYSLDREPHASETDNLDGGEQPVFKGMTLRRKAETPSIFADATMYDCLIAHRYLAVWTIS